MPLHEDVPFLFILVVFVTSFGGLFVDVLGYDLLKFGMLKYQLSAPTPEEEILNRIWWIVTESCIRSRDILITCVVPALVVAGVVTVIVALVTAVFFFACVAIVLTDAIVCGIREWAREAGERTRAYN